MPKNMEKRINDVIKSDTSGDKVLKTHLNMLLDNLDQLLKSEGIEPNEIQSLK